MPQPVTQPKGGNTQQTTRVAGRGRMGIRRRRSRCRRAACPCRFVCSICGAPSSERGLSAGKRPLQTAHANKWLGRNMTVGRPRQFLIIAKATAMLLAACCVVATASTILARKRDASILARTDRPRNSQAGAQERDRRRHRQSAAETNSHICALPPEHSHRRKLGRPSCGVPRCHEGVSAHLVLTTKRYVSVLLTVYAPCGIQRSWPPS
jgi:hypothetical protein